MELYEPLPVAFDPLLKPAEAADYIHLGSKSTLSKWRTQNRSDRPRAFKDGRKVRYRVSDLDAWLRSCPGYAQDQEGPHTTMPRRRPAPGRLTLVTMQSYWYEVLHRDPLLSIDEAAQYLAIPKSTLYTNRTRQPGWGPTGVDVAGRIRYRLSALNDWVEARLEDGGLRLAHDEEDVPAARVTNH